MIDNTSFALHVLKDRCTGCGLCADSCAYNAIRFDEYPEIDPSACRLCGNCVQNCPAEALQIDTPDTPTAPQEKTTGVWVLAETVGNALAPVTKELLGKAAVLAEKLHQDVEAVLVGYGIAALADELTAYGAKRVHLAEKAELAAFVEENQARAVVEIVKECRPEILLVGATQRGRGLSARMAALLHTGLTADCTELDIDTASGLLLQIRPAFGGNLMATIKTPHCRPQMASVRPGIMRAPERRTSLKAEIIRHELPGFESDKRIRLITETADATGGETLSNSRIVIGIGRGVKSKETVDRIHQWATRIGAAVAGSRAAVEAGLIDARLQVGQTGQAIAPELYIAIGISGQIQHTAGIAGAKTIIAINPDRTAPIFHVADYGWAVQAEEAISELGI